MLDGMRDLGYLMRGKEFDKEEVAVILVIAKRIASLTEVFEAQNQLLERICDSLDKITQEGRDAR